MVIEVMSGISGWTMMCQRRGCRVGSREREGRGNKHIFEIEMRRLVHTITRVTEGRFTCYLIAAGRGQNLRC